MNRPDQATLQTSLQKASRLQGTLVLMDKSELSVRVVEKILEGYAKLKSSNLPLNLDEFQLTDFRIILPVNQTTNQRIHE